MLCQFNQVVYGVMNCEWPFCLWGPGVWGTVLRCRWCTPKWISPRKHPDSRPRWAVSWLTIFQVYCHLLLPGKLSFCHSTGSRPLEEYMPMLSQMLLLVAFPFSNFSLYHVTITECYHEYNGLWVPNIRELSRLRVILEIHRHNTFIWNLKYIFSGQPWFHTMPKA